MMKRNVMPVFIALLVFILFAAGCGGSSSKTSSDSAKSSQVFTNTNWAELDSSPDKFKGSSVEVLGKVFIDPKTTGFQMYANPKDSGFNTIVYFNDPNLSIKKGDFVKVTGIVKGAFSGENAFGAKLSAPSITASAVQVIDGKDVLAPTILKIEPKQSKNQHGLSITLDSVEFAKEETRLYITVFNGSTNKASFYSFNAKATQNGSQYSDQSNYDIKYPEVQSEILPNVTSHGVVVLAPMNVDAKAAQFYLEGGTDNYRLDFDPYVFNVTW